MCEWIDGQIIVSFPEENEVGLALVEALIARNIAGAIYRENLETRIGTVTGNQVNQRHDLYYQAHLIDVPPHLEIYYISRLYEEFRLKLIEFLDTRGLGAQALLMKSAGFNVQPNHVMSTTATIRSADFSFNSDHVAYLSMLGLPVKPAPADASTIQVMVLDSGIADDLASDPSITLSQRLSFVDHKDPNPVDKIGHGTAITRIIHDIIPDAQILSYKIADDTSRISEWDTLAGLAADSGAHVINMSLQFGLPDLKKGLLCSTCGRESHHSRSAVFEAIIQRVSESKTAPVIIASAGNDGQSELSFPARFGLVVAISSVTRHGELSSFSNYGDKDQDGNLHQRRFVLPGGEDNRSPKENIGKFVSQSKPYVGTSFAAAYASGLAATLLAQHGVHTLTSGHFWDLLRTQATTSTINHYDPDLHGHGMLRL